MKMKLKRLKIILLMSVLLSTLAACGGSGIPNGRYVPVDDAVGVTIQAIIIDGNNFTQVMLGGLMSTTLKFEYSEGTVTFTEGTSGVSFPCEYDEDEKILTYASIDFILSDD
jgi:predicted small lipoprotein YifL